MIPRYWKAALAEIAVTAAAAAALAGCVPQAAAAPALPAAVSPGSHVWHWAMAPSADGGATRFPRPDGYCAARVNRFRERIPANAAANATPGPANPADDHWGPWATQQGDLWDGYLSKADGHFTGTTTEILEWAACKWGLEEDWLKGEAVAESSWAQAENGDGGQSFGILQVKVTQGSDPSADDAWGGYPWVQRSTALCADFVAAYLRATFDGVRGTGFYGGQTVGQIAAAHGWDYVMQDSIGSWYSGDFNANGDAQDYIDSVMAAANGRTWMSYGN